MKDTYLTITGPAEGEFRDKGSKFFAYAFPAFDEETCHEHLSDIRKLHPKARHHCYAWRIGTDGNLFRSNDDGEPSGTAGRPMLGQIDSFGLVNTCVIVVRYFGGTLLGTSGLINAYKNSTADALSKAEIEERIIEDVYGLTFDYSLMSNVMNGLSRLKIDMVTQDFGTIGKVEIAIRQSEVEDKLKQLKAIVADVYIEQVDDLDGIDGFELAFLRTR